MATGHFRIGIQLAPATALVIRDFLLTGQSDFLPSSA
jgi:glycine/D-amino acid oxidase-like deaminating enzyme